MFVYVSIKAHIYSAVDVRCKYYLWHHATSLLFRGNLSKMHLRFKSSESHQTQTCGEVGNTQYTLISTFRTFHKKMLVWNWVSPASFLRHRPFKHYTIPFLCTKSDPLANNVLDGTISFHSSSVCTWNWMGVVFKLCQILHGFFDKSKGEQGKSRGEQGEQKNRGRTGEVFRG